MTPAREHPSHDHGELPAALHHAQSELDAYIRARTSPDSVLLKIMQAADDPRDSNQGSSAAGPGSAPDVTRAITIIRMRALAQDLHLGCENVRGRDLALADARDLARDLAHTEALVRARDLDVDLARVFDLDVDLARDLNRDLARDIDSARDIARDLDHELVLALVRDGKVIVALADARDIARVLDRDVALALAREVDLDLDLDLVREVVSSGDFDRLLARVLDVVFNLARDLAPAIDDVINLARDLSDSIASGCGYDRARDLDLAVDRVLARALAVTLDLEKWSMSAESQTRALEAAGPVDVSGADLSGEDLDDLDVLEGVIWTRATTWPPGVADHLLMRSREIRKGVYQVRGKEGRDRVMQID